MFFEVVLVLYVQLLLPAIAFTLFVLPDFVQQLSPLRIGLLVILSIIGWLLSRRTTKHIRMYRLDIDTPPPEEQMGNSRMILVGYVFISLVLGVDLLMQPLSIYTMIALSIVLANIVFLVIVFRKTLTAVKFIYAMYIKQQERRPPSILLEEDLKEMYERRDGQALLGALEGADDPRLRAMAARFLGQLGDPTVTEDLSRSLFDKSEEVQIETAIALCHLGDERGLHFFDDWLRFDSAVKLRAIEALLVLNTVNARIALQFASKDSDPKVASRALNALIKARSRVEKLSELEWESIPMDE